MDAQLGAVTGLPLVSIIAPYRERHARFAPLLRECVAAQSYPTTRVELLLEQDLYEDVGAMRNYLCSRARGEILLAFDVDDYHWPGRAAASVAALLSDSSALACGTSVFFACDAVTGALAEARSDRVRDFSLAFRREAWEDHPFAERVSFGEAEDFIAAHEGRTVDLLTPVVTYLRNGLNTVPWSLEGSRPVPENAMLPAVKEWLHGDWLARYRAALVR